MPRTLHYSQRDAYVRGLDDILARPALTLEQEFSRKARRAAPPAPRAQLPATSPPPPRTLPPRWDGPIGRARAIRSRPSGSTSTARPMRATARSLVQGRQQRRLAEPSGRRLPRTHGDALPVRGRSRPSAVPARHPRRARRGERGPDAAGLQGAHQQAHPCAARRAPRGRLGEDERAAAARSARLPLARGGAQAPSTSP